MARSFASRTFAQRTFNSRTWSGVGAAAEDTSTGSGFSSWFLPAGMTFDNNYRVVAGVPGPKEEVAKPKEKATKKKRRHLLLALDDDFALLARRT